MPRPYSHSVPLTVAAAPITIFKDCEVAERPYASVTLTVMVDAPSVIGVPVMFTVFAVLDAKLSPLGRGSFGCNYFSTTVIVESAVPGLMDMR